MVKAEAGHIGQWQLANCCNPGCLHLTVDEHAWCLILKGNQKPDALYCQVVRGMF